MMIRLNPAAVLLLPLLALPASCVVSIGNGESSQRAVEARGIRSRNLERLNTLSIGMTLEAVKQRMGESSVWMNDDVGWIDNPYRTESFRSKDGAPVVVLYYYTHLRKRDNVIADDELTPVGFADGVLIGWGWSFFDRTIQTM